MFTVTVKAVRTVPFTRSVGRLLLALSGVELLGWVNSTNGASAIWISSSRLPLLAPPWAEMASKPMLLTPVEPV